LDDQRELVTNDEANDSDARKELKRARREIEKAKRRAKEADKLAPDDLAAALLPDLTMKW
jgi:hypothetical protein